MKYCNKCQKYQTAVNTDGRCYKCYSLCVEKEETLLEAMEKDDIDAKLNIELKVLKGEVVRLW